VPIQAGVTCGLVPYTPDHPVFRAAPDDAPLWRYMDFTKFVSLLDRGALYFARADQLGDPFEGSYPAANQPMRAQWAREQGLPDDAFEDLELARRIQPQLHYISAWHLNEVESAAMWSLYLRTGEGIAIRSTFKRLCDSMAADPHVIYVGLVGYLDYDTTPIPEGNMFWPFVHKRLSFEHEREVRAVIADFDYFWNIRARLEPEQLPYALSVKQIAYEAISDIDLDVALPLPPPGLYICRRPGRPDRVRICRAVCPSMVRGTR
jgi:hypothetical protein